MDGYLLKKAQIEAMEGEKKTHFQNPNAIRVNKSIGDATGLTGIGVHIIEVEPGRDTTEYHRHFHEDECVYVLSGTATARIGDESFEIEQGDFIGYRAGGLAHGITVTGTETFRCLVMGQRLDHDAGEYPEKRKRIYRNAGLPWVVFDEDAAEELPGTVGKK